MSSGIAGGNSTLIRTRGVRTLALAAALLTSVALIFTMIYRADAAAPANSYFETTWERTDQPVISGQVDRTWLWGPEGFTGEMTEPYADSPGGDRTVQYFDKSRMEITDPSADSSSVWYVTNGLLVVELVTGRMQMGDDSFTQYQPANVNVAGDQDVVGVQYSTLADLLDAPALADGATITQRIDLDGDVTNDPSLAGFGVTADYLVSVPGIEHQVASPFWEFMNSSGTVYENGAYLDAPMFLSAFYATGYPITEAYWANVKVAGTYQDVLLQCFERRCLTYTPGNEPGWQVEAGNVGQHYYEWRYGQIGDDEPTATAPPTGTPPASPTPEPTPDPSATPTPDPALDYDFLGKIDDAWDPTTKMALPRSIASGEGYVYVADLVNDRVQKYTVDGYLVDTWDGFNNPYDVEIGPNGNIWVVDTYNHVVKEFGPDGTFLTQIGTGTTACGPGELNSPSSVAFSNNGQIYVVENGNNRVQRFNANGAPVAVYGDPTCAPGVGNNAFIAPDSIAFDANNNFYVTDSGSNRVVKFNTAGTYITEFGNPNGVAPLDEDGELNFPLGISVSPSGRVYVADSGNDRIQGFDLDGNYLGQWGEPGTGPGEFGDPVALDVDEDGNVYVVDMAFHNVQKFDGIGTYLDTFSDNRRGYLGDETRGMTLDAAGNVYVTDTTFDRVLKFDAQGNYLLEFGETGIAEGQMDYPMDVAAGPDGYLYVVDYSNEKVLKFTQDGEFIDEWGANGDGNGQFIAPYGIEVDASGNVYVADTGNDRIQKFDPDGDFIASWEAPDVIFDAPMDIAIHENRAYVVESGNHRVQGFTLDGVPIGQWGSYGATGDGRFDTPAGIGVDAYGFVYVADSNNDRIQKFTPNGDYLAQFGMSGNQNGYFDTPLRVDVAANGYVYVLDADNNRVQVFEPVN